MPVTFDQIVAARERIESGVVMTPCAESLVLSETCGCTIFAKLEYLQRTGSFKERGACNALLQLSPEARTRGVIAASAGNHALALAYHGRRLGIPVTVVMPQFAPMIKQSRCVAMGATVVLEGLTIAQSKVKAEALAARPADQGGGQTYIHGFDAPEVIAGQGTIGLEVLDQIHGLDAVVCPIGGGGLIAGVSLAIKTARPQVKIIGVQAEHCPGFAESLKAGKVTTVQAKPTLADGLAVPTIGARSFDIARTRVDRVVTVSEEHLALAILRIVEGEKGVVEGAGAAPLAAFLSGQLSELRGKRVALLHCGGNIDPTVLGRAIGRGLVVDGRMTQFTAIIADRPGGLAELTAAVAAGGACVKQIEHERAFTSADISTVQVLCTVETRDAAHVEELHGLLQGRGIRVIARTQPGACPMPKYT